MIFDKGLESFIDALQYFTDHKKFEGSLTVEQITECRDAAIITAQSLLEDAKLLYEHERYERATALAILSIEECNKATIPLYFLFLLLNENLSPSTFWKDYRNHTAKSKGWMMPMMPSLLNLLSGFWQEVKNKESKLYDALHSPQYAQIINKLKQRCFYSDFVDEGKAILPNDLPADLLAKSFIELAQYSSEDLKKTDINLLHAITEFLDDRDYQKLVKKLKVLNPDYSFLAEFLNLSISGNSNEESILSIFADNYSEIELDNKEELMKKLTLMLELSPLNMRNLNNELSKKDS